jgi:hypothetical protein
MVRSDALLVLPPPWGVDFPPLGLASLATYARTRGHRVIARDLNIEAYTACDERFQSWWHPERLKFWEAGRRLDELQQHLGALWGTLVDQVAKCPPRMIGFSTNEANLPLACRIAQKLRQANVDTPIIFGGPGVAFPADRRPLDADVIDAFVIGEGEMTLVSLIDAIKAGDPLDTVAAVARHGNTEERWPTAQTQISDLDSLPTPRFDDFPLELYQTHQLPLQFGRGCIRRCAFCNDPVIVPRYRSKTAEKLFEEVCTYVERHDVRCFQFNDLLINADLERLRRFVALLLERRQQITFSGQATIDIEMDQAFFFELARGGCRSLVFGVESFSDRVLSKMRKGYTAKEAQMVLTRCKQAKIHVIINLIVGFPGEGEEELAETLDWLRQNHDLIDHVSALSTCIVTPNCTLERHPERFGIVLPEPEHWCQWHSEDRENRQDTRERRLQRILQLLDHFGIDHGMTNRYEESSLT